MQWLNEGLESIDERPLILTLLKHFRLPQTTNLNHTVMYTELLTDHMVDDIAPQDEAMDCFRSNFRLWKCNVTQDGKLMIYRVNGDAKEWLTKAQEIIKSGHLPLVAELVTEITGTFIHIIYKASRAIMQVTLYTDAGRLRG
jgi:hypothetical protein